MLKVVAWNTSGEGVQVRKERLKRRRKEKRGKKVYYEPRYVHSTQSLCMVPGQWRKKGKRPSKRNRKWTKGKKAKTDKEGK